MHLQNSLLTFSPIVDLDLLYIVIDISLSNSSTLYSSLKEDRSDKYLFGGTYKDLESVLLLFGSTSTIFQLSYKCTNMYYVDIVIWKRLCIDKHFLIEILKNGCTLFQRKVPNGAILRLFLSFHGI